MKLNFYNYPDILPEFYDICDLKVSDGCLVLSSYAGYIMASLWEDYEGALVWRSQETGNPIKKVTAWASL